MSSRYDHAFDFFRLLSEVEAELPGGRALANPSTPLLLSNAVWYPNAAELEPVAGWYAERGIEPAVVVPAACGGELGDALQRGPYLRTHAFAYVSPRPGPVQEPDGVGQERVEQVRVEQVGWAQGRALGEVLAMHYGMPEFGIALGKTLAAALQEAPEILGFVAYGDGATGAMAVCETPETLTAMLMGGKRDALESRLIAEAADRGRAPLVLEVLPEGVAATDERTFERWSIR